MLIRLHMFSLSVVCTLNTQLKLLRFKWCMVLRQAVNGNFNLTPTVYTAFEKGASHRVELEGFTIDGHIQNLVQ